MTMNMRIGFGSVSALACATFLLLTNVAYAHSTVSPSQTLTQKYETFSVSVPTEREVPTVRVRLLIPATLDHVTPMVKPGWRINTTKNASGTVTQIEWVGGVIPAGQKDIFQFSGRTPATPGTLIWKVYQTYQDGEVVAWERDPKALNAGEEKVPNPYSTTEATADNASASSQGRDLPLAISLSSLALSLGALWITLRKSKQA